MPWAQAFHAMLVGVLLVLLVVIYEYIDGSVEIDIVPLHRKVAVEFFLPNSLQYSYQS